MKRDADGNPAEPCNCEQALALEKEVRRLRRALRRHGEHYAGCSWFNGGCCDCGLGDALRGPGVQQHEPPPHIEPDELEGFAVYADPEGECPKLVGLFESEADARLWAESAEGTLDVTPAVAALLIANDYRVEDLGQLRAALPVGKHRLARVVREVREFYNEELFPPPPPALNKGERLLTRQDTYAAAGARLACDEIMRRLENP